MRLNVMDTVGTVWSRFVLANAGDFLGPQLQVMT